MGPLSEVTQKTHRDITDTLIKVLVAMPINYRARSRRARRLRKLVTEDEWMGTATSVVGS